ncbi:MAG: hypothetical protein OEO84_16515 [Betaproteobacteria bacterium]|nr:hypothetical protein [Betaproteobacteria bacterium]
MLALGACGLAVAQIARQWRPLAMDGVHDPKSPALGLLQEPGEALSKLPPDTAGNQVAWVRALEEGTIEPRATLFRQAPMEVRDTDVLLNLKGSTPVVRFPHKPHTRWLACSNCHDQLFKKEPGSNVYSMERILQGEQCGVCHGAVAFPLTECNRCHSVPRRSPALAAPGAGR